MRVGKFGGKATRGAAEEGRWEEAGWSVMPWGRAVVVGSLEQTFAAVNLQQARIFECARRPIEHDLAFRHADNAIGEAPSQIHVVNIDDHRDISLAGATG